MLLSSGRFINVRPTKCTEVVPCYTFCLMAVCCCFFVVRGCHLASNVTTARWRQPPSKLALDGEGHLTVAGWSLSHCGKRVLLRDTSAIGGQLVRRPAVQVPNFESSGFVLHVSSIHCVPLVTVFCMRVT